MISVADVKIKNRNGEVFAKGKTLLDSAFEKDFVSGNFIPVKSIFKMYFSDVEYYETPSKPYPEFLDIICQIVSANPEENNIERFVFKVDEIYLYNGHKEVDRIIKRLPSFYLFYNDKRKTLSK